MAIATRPEKQPNADGFTLIELVLVVVILGVLAAFALPRFSDLSTDARLAALESLEGTMMHRGCPQQPAIPAEYRPTM